ncbi:hypothetical protein MMC31_003941, partial [Peltigera leucophlebia]|nr:hypothetical protein [Peltigera leucophlebia]
MRGHEIEVDGSLECSGSDWEHMSDASPVALDPIESHTPAAGLQCSGITLERRYIMTVHHFHGISEECLIELIERNSKAVSISIGRSTAMPSASKEFQDLTIRRAFLRYFNKERGFALFQLDDESKDFPNSVRSSQLIATDQLDFLENPAGKRVWSVDYACEEDERYPKYWELLQHVVSHENSQVIEDMHEVT